MFRRSVTLRGKLWQISTTTSVATATTFSISSSSSSGLVNVAQTATVSPINGNWPVNQSITLTISGISATISPTSQIGSGSSSVQFSYTPTSTGSAIINATAAGMTSTGSQSYVVSSGATSVPTSNPVFVSGAATRYDIKSSNSSVQVNSPTNVDIIPNGNWSGQTLTLMLTKGSGTYPSTLTAPSSGNAIVSFNFTPTVSGEHSIRITSPGLYTPLTHPINSFNSSSGVASALSASLVRSDQAPHQYNVLGKKPNGFENITCVGWSRVGISVSLSQATSALFIKLIDASSNGATTSLGTGTYLNTTPIQVYGPLPSGNSNINLLLPASLYYYFAEIATDAAFTNPVRIANRFTCGLIVGLNQRSMECAIARNYSYGTSTITTAYIKNNVLIVNSTNNGDNYFYVGGNITDTSGNHALISSYGTGTGSAGTYNLSNSMPDNGTQANPTTLYVDPVLGQTCNRAVTSVTFDSRYGGYNSWYRHDGYTPGPNIYYGEGSSAATMRFADLVGHYLGVTVGFSGATIAGGGVDSHINHDGSPCGGFSASIANVESEYRWAWFNNIGWDAVDSNYPTELFSEVYNRISANCDYTMKTNPSVALIGLAYGCMGWNLNNGSILPINTGSGVNGPGGEYRFKEYLMGNLVSSHIFDKSSSGIINGNAPNSHPGQGARTSYAEVSLRSFLAAELAAMGGNQTKQIGPLINSSGTIVRGSNTVRVGFTHRGGTQVVSHSVSYDQNNPTRVFQTSTAAELASIFTIYAGANSSSGSTVVNVSGVVIDNTNNQFVITLVSGQSLQDNMTLQFNCDYGVSNSTLQSANPYRAAFLTDERTDSSAGINYGYLMLSKVDIAITTV